MVLIVGFDENVIDYIRYLLESYNKKSKRFLVNHNLLINWISTNGVSNKNSLESRLFKSNNGVSNISEIVVAIQFDSIDLKTDFIEKILVRLLTSLLKNESLLSKDVAIVLLLLFPSSQIVSSRKQLNIILDQMKCSLKNLKYIQFKMEVNFRINSLIPLFVRDDTDFCEPWMRRLQIRQPLNRYVTSEDIANTLSFLLSEESQALRGQQIVLDYGYLD